MKKWVRQIGAALLLLAMVVLFNRRPATEKEREVREQEILNDRLETLKKQERQHVKGLLTAEAAKVLAAKHKVAARPRTDDPVADLRARMDTRGGA